MQYLEINVNSPHTDSDSLDKLNESKSIAEVNFIEDDEDSMILKAEINLKNYQRIRLIFKGNYVIVWSTHNTTSIEV